MRLPALRQVLAATAATSALLLTAACGGSSDAAGGTTDSSAAEAPAGVDPNATYTDGTYEASGSYANPGGESSIDVTVTVADNVVTDLKLEPGATGTSLAYQKQFIGGAAKQVVGKPLGEINVKKVSGSSLTSGGFTKALDQIRQDATA